MPVYANLSGRSNVASWEETGDSIEVTFAGKPPNRYLYTRDSVGGGNLATMKALAAAGQGLNSFISRVVKKRYARKR